MMEMIVISKDRELLFLWHGFSWSLPVLFKDYHTLPIDKDSLKLVYPNAVREAARNVFKDIRMKTLNRLYYRIRGVRVSLLYENKVRDDLVVRSLHDFLQVAVDAREIILYYDELNISANPALKPKHYLPVHQLERLLKASMDFDKYDLQSELLSPKNR